MSPLPRRMLGRAASWENPQVHPSSLPERKLTYVGVAVAIRLFVGNPHQILNSPQAAEQPVIGILPVRELGSDFLAEQLQRLKQKSLGAR